MAACLQTSGMRRYGLRTASCPPPPRKEAIMTRFSVANTATDSETGPETNHATSPHAGARAKSGLVFHSSFSQDDRHPFDEVEWELRDAIIQDSQGGAVFAQKQVRVPSTWSQTATNIVASKYLHGALGTDAREGGVDDLIRRVTSTIRTWGVDAGYFRAYEDADVFERELAALLVGQYAAFNSPVWFNVGCDRLEPENRAKSWHWDREQRRVVQTGA